MLPWGSTLGQDGVKGPAFILSPEIAKKREVRETNSDLGFHQVPAELARVTALLNRLRLDTCTQSVNYQRRLPWKALPAAVLDVTA